MIDMALCNRIRRLYFAEHWKVGTIASQLGLHRQTVEHAIRAERFGGQPTIRSSALDPFEEMIRRTLDEHPRLTATRIYQMVRARGYQGSARQVRHRIRQLDLRPRKTPEAFLRVTTVAGEQAQADWGHFGTIDIGSTRRTLSLFVVVLSWSRAVHVHFSLDCSMAAVLRGHAAAFSQFGGVPRTMLYDNMKTVVLERVDDAYHFHPRLLELAGHYHFAPQPCHPYRANEKGRVERRIRDLRSSFFEGRRFVDLDDLHRQFITWRDDVAYLRPCPSQPALTVAQALAKEREVLLPLPQNPIDTDDVVATVARKQPYVIYDTNRYSIPHDRVGRPLTLVAGQQLIRVLDGNEQVAVHHRCWQRKMVIEDPAHIRALVHHRHQATVTAGRSRLLAAVPQAEALYGQLVARQERLAPHTALLLQLLEHYGPGPLGQAIEQAMQRNTPLSASVALLLNAGHHRKTTPVPLNLHLPDRPAICEMKTAHHPLENYDDLIDHDPLP